VTIFAWSTTPDIEEIEGKQAFALVEYAPNLMADTDFGTITMRTGSFR